MHATIAASTAEHVAGTTIATTRRAHSPALNIGLWTVQGILAALFLFAGASKLVMPVAALTQQLPLPGVFFRAIGVFEILGALGLVLPGIFRIHTFLTSRAASCLVVIMSGAVGCTLAIGGGAGALVPGVVGVLLTVVAYGRTRVVPLSDRR